MALFQRQSWGNLSKMEAVGGGGGGEAHMDFIERKHIFLN